MAGGAMMKFERGATSKSRLNIAWDNSSVTRLVQVKDQAAALEHMADGDRRPLLVLRLTHDIGSATKKVRKLLKDALASERFKLTSHWFHCVQVTKEVMAKDHPYHCLFSGRSAPRIILATADGQKVVHFLGNARQRVNWADIAAVLKTSYEKNPTTAIRSLERLLHTFDVLDAKISGLGDQIASASEKNKTTSLTMLKAKLEKLEEERGQALAEEKVLKDLVLRKLDEKKAEKGR